MRLSEFDFSFPPEQIARYPSAVRGESKLLIAHRKSGEIIHTTFSKICDFLEEGDVVVVNQSRVFPARLMGRKETGGRIELLLLENLSGNRFRCLAFPLKRLKEGNKIYFPCHSEPHGRGISAEILEINSSDESVVVNFNHEGDFQHLLEEVGHVPLPPYLRREDEPIDRERYQTVFAKKRGGAKERGSSAAPTAGLHWTEGLLEEVRLKGVDVVPITLHVGRGTFLPIREEEIEKHKMHSEYVEISEEAAQKINRAKRVIAVGTTVVRALEFSVHQLSRQQPGSHPKVIATSGYTDLYIYPGYTFQIVDVLQTNFHQPQSTLLVMVSAFGGTDFIRHCYAEALERDYRLFSYGDAMLIL